MHVLLVHPPESVATDAQERVRPRPPPAPSWLLLSLLTFLRARTGHQGHLLDARLYARFEEDYSAALTRTGSPRVVVVQADDLHLGEVMAVVEATRRRAPDAPIILCGPHPSAYPQHALALPHVDFALAGDPEVPLRQLLEFLHVPNRLRLVPGLISRVTTAPAAAWLPDLSVLPVPAWDGPAWPAYESTIGTGVRAEMRISRGHSGSAADRASGEASQPLRFWPLDRLAANMEKCAHKGVVEIMVNDPPGLWTPDRLRAWCAALQRARHTHPWSFRSLPRQFSPAELDHLADAHCAAVEFILPSCDPALLERYECRIEPRRLPQLAGDLRRVGVETRLRFWLGGPEEGRGESARVRHWLDRAGATPVVLEPFPLHFDSPLYRQLPPSHPHPTVEGWLAWSRDPWMNTRPPATWGGHAAASALAREMEALQQHGVRSPAQRLRRYRAWWRNRSVVGEMEQRLIGLFRRPTRP